MATPDYSMIPPSNGSPFNEGPLSSKPLDCGKQAIYMDPNLQTKEADIAKAMLEELGSSLSKVWKEVTLHQVFVQRETNEYFVEAEIHGRKFYVHGQSAEELGQQLKMISVILDACKSKGKDLNQISVAVLDGEVNVSVSYGDRRKPERENQQFEGKGSVEEISRQFKSNVLKRRRTTTTPSPDVLKRVKLSWQGAIGENQDIDLQILASDNPHIFSSDELKERVIQREVRLMQKGMQRAVGNEIYQLQALDQGSANPVARMKPELFIAVEDIPKEVKSSFQNASEAYEAVKSLFDGRVNELSGEDKTTQDWLKGMDSDLQPETVRLNRIEQRKTGQRFRNVTVEEYKDQVSRLIQKEITKNEARLAEALTGESKDHLLLDSKGEYESRTEILKSILDDVKSIFDTPISLQNVTEQFSKDELMSNVRVLLEARPDVSRLGVLNRIERFKGEMIPVHDLENLIEDKEILKAITRNARKFVSSYDVIAKNGNAKSVQEGLEKIYGNIPASSFGRVSPTEHMDRPGYAFKTGVENHREILAGKVLEMIGLSRFVARKAEVGLQGTQLGKKKHPEGIASKWLEDASALSKRIYEYTDARHQILKGAMLYGGVDLQNELNELDAKISALEAEKKLLEVDIEDEDEKKLDAVIVQIREGNTLKDNLSRIMRARSNIDQIEEAVKAELEPESTNELALIDMLMFAGDSHSLQYMVREGGEIECIDFARFLPPGVAYKKNVGIGKDEKYETVIPLRSALLGHPHCEDLIPDKILKKIKEWEPEEFEKLIREQGLVQSEEYFQERMERFEAAEDPEERARLREEMVQFIHPNALSAMKQRMVRMKEYVQKERAPTIKGMFHHAEPQVARLLEIMERGVTTPALCCWIRLGDNGLVRPHTLEETVVFLKKEGLISEEEEVEMTGLIDQLHKESCSEAELNCAMSW